MLRFAGMRGDAGFGPALERDPRVETTLDLALQRRLSWAVWRTVAEWERQGAGNAAALVVEKGSWEVLAAVGGAILAGKLVGRIVGLSIVTIAMVMNFVSLPIYPLWSIVMIALCIFIMWALCAEDSVD